MHVVDRLAFTSTWGIDGAGSGNLSDGLNNVDFSNFTDLTGTNAVDNFTITGNAASGVSGVMNGMGGSSRR